MASFLLFDSLEKIIFFVISKMVFTWTVVVDQIHRWQYCSFGTERYA